MPSIFQLCYRRPFDWEFLLAYFATRGVPGVEAVIGGRYLRTIELKGEGAWLAVENEPEHDTLKVTVASRYPKVEEEIAPRLRRLFDLEADPDLIAQQLGKDPDLATSVATHPGLRLPGAWDFFELSIRAILGQQISVARGSALAGKLAARFGKELETPFPSLNRICFTPRAIAGASIEELAAIGMPQSRARTLQSLARAFVAGKLDFGPNTPLVELLTDLQRIPGIGPWTANYIAMRGLSLPDAFPTADLGLLKATGLKTAKELDSMAEKWRPWRSYAALHLWHSLPLMP